MEILLLILVGLLAFANGANDNSKGVATLVGYGAATPRKALIWATATTFLGAVFSFWFAGGLVKGFSTGLFVRGTQLELPFYLAVLCGAFAWVIFATLTGLPVSTTHAITGALTGAGLVALGSARFEWSFLGAKFALPLGISPVLALGLVYLIAWPVALIAAKLASRCVCVMAPPMLAPGGTALAVENAGAPHLAVGDVTECNRQDTLLRAPGSAALNGLHWLSAGMVGFARGWNDAPKIAALAVVVLPASGGGMAGAFGLVAVAMAIGGMVAGRKVLETLATKVTTLPLPESLTASLTTATLVSLASWNGMPVSTTHVSTGAIIGAGLRNDPRAVRWGKVGEIALSWVVTLPCAAGIAAAVMALLRVLR